jgi:type VI secretion system protein VasG
MKRLKSSQNINASYTDKVVDLIASRCTEVDTGARNIDHILRATLIPLLSSAILEQMAAGSAPESVVVDADEHSNFVTRFGSAAAAE